MSDTANCCHKQFVGQLEFCPDCGLSRNEVLIAECAPFLKDDETPAECIRRNRKDVDGCLSLLVAEKRKNADLLRERDEAVALLRYVCSLHPDDCGCSGCKFAFLSKVKP